MFPTRRITTSGGDKFRDELSLAFDGTNDYVQLSDPFNHTNISISAWIKRTDDNASHVIFSNQDGAGDGLIFFTTDDEYVRVGVNSTTTDEDAGALITANTWNHVVAAITDNSKIEVYVNGVLGSDKSLSGSISVSTNARIGMSAYDLITQYNGNISEVAIYDKALSASEVKTLYNGREPYNHKEGVCSSNLQGWWRMGDGALDDRNGLVADQTNATISNHLDDTFTSDTGWSGQKTITGGQLTKNDAGLVYRNDILTISAGDVIKFTVDTESISGTNLKAYVGGTQKSISSTGVSVIYIIVPSSPNQFIGFNNGDGSVFNSLKIDKVGANAGTTENMDATAFKGDTP